MADSTPKSYSSDPALYVYTSLTSGSSHIVTATSRMETILRANRIPFKAIDIATDEKARMLWGRRAGKDESGRVRKIPGLVQMGLVLGDLVDVEDWNEYGELKQHVTMYYDEFTMPSKAAASQSTPSKAPANQKENVKPAPATPETAKFVEETKAPAGGQATSFTLAMRQVGQEAAAKAKDVKKKVEPLVGLGTAEPEAEKKDELEEAKKEAVAITSKDEPQAEAEESEEESVSEPIATSKKKATPQTEDQELSAKPSLNVESAPHTIDTLPSVQSPNSTAWKPTTTSSPAPVLTYQASTVKHANPEETESEESESEESESEESGED